MNILEPMCGSGRYLISFIEKGHNIDGFDISKDMLEICRIKMEKLNINSNNIIQCCGFEEFTPNKKYDLIFIASGSFSLIINNNDIIEKIKILENLCNKDGKVLIELLIIEDISKKLVSEIYSKDRTVKKDNIEISIFNKIIKIDEKQNIEYMMFKYELYKNGKYIREEEENFNIKYYKPNEFEKYLEGTSLKIENKYINHEKEKYVNQKAERIIYELIKL
jgi:SAM-dependent methyltransferase